MSAMCDRRVKLMGQKHHSALQTAMLLILLMVLCPKTGCQAIPEHCPENGAFACHPTEPSAFTRCIEHQLFAFQCPEGLHFNTRIQTCDWPQNADCGSQSDGSEEGQDHRAEGASAAAGVKAAAAAKDSSHDVIKQSPVMDDGQHKAGENPTGKNHDGGASASASGGSKWSAEGHVSADSKPWWRPDNVDPKAWEDVNNLNEVPYDGDSDNGNEESQTEESDSKEDESKDKSGEKVSKKTGKKSAWSGSKESKGGEWKGKTKTEEKSGKGGSWEGEGSKSGKGGSWEGEGSKSGKGGSWEGEGSKSGKGGSWEGEGSKSGKGGSWEGEGSKSGKGGSWEGEGSKSGKGGSWEGEGSKSGKGGSWEGEGSKSGKGGSWEGEGSKSGKGGSWEGEGSKSGKGGSWEGEGSKSGKGGSWEGEGSKSGKGGSWEGEGSKSGKGESWEGEGSKSGKGGSWEGEGSKSGKGGSWEGEGSKSGEKERKWQIKGESHSHAHLEAVNQLAESRPDLDSIQWHDGPCSHAECTLPSCRCPGTDIPGGLSPKSIPQMVMITFDDEVSAAYYGYFQRLFRPGRYNPNGCPVRGCLYVSGSGTDYDLVNPLYAMGVEVASHTLSHKFPHTWWATASYQEYVDEVGGMREALVSKAGVPRETIKGFRVPFLQLGADNMYKALYDQKFLFDSSMFTGSVWEGSDPVWPFTLDYTVPEVYCQHGPCPVKQYPGLWEIPVQRWYGVDGHSCAMPDGCTASADMAEDLEFFRSNFRRYYESNRAPFGIFVHARWFHTEHHLDALDQFIDELMQLDDVYIVTPSQVIEWVKNPTTLESIHGFKPWGCEGGLSATGHRR